ncbi:glycosyltransferase family 1 protein [Sphingobium sp. AP49]|uniref:glycosyltransferase family 4 protein n=1 Tax=Sphingobium sp. AP49 TaxID=1144307 RepID=UPI00026ECA81|nr:glycosyltransferase family 1 protein [Sphingobium sp. AP49]WHO40772.1 glycosyltransferase family 1 protein [Sphingobium sp. AP49]
MSLRVILSVEALEPRLSGIGRYSWELAQRIGAAPEVDAVRFYRNGDWIEDPSRLLIPDGIPRRHKVHRWLRNRTKGLRRWRDGLIARGHLFHGPNYFLPEIGEGGLITVHDLSVFRYPETHPAERLRYFEREFAASLARAAHIVTDSATTRDEVIDFLSIAPDRVTAIPLAASPAFMPRAAAETLPALARYGLSPQGYALCVSTVEPRKRIPHLLQAWAALPPSVRNRWPLMVTGGAGWLSDDVQALMAQGAREGWVRYLGFVPEEDLPLLYAGAALFVYPSVYEGFGLPPVEAMASGVPVVVANASCLPEVTGGAAMLVEPEDVPAFALRLEQALVDTDWRNMARNAGLVVAAGYGWDRCARETVALYGRVAGA